MPIRNQNWYDLQSGRKYPIDDTSSCLDDSGNLLRNDIIVDCNIRFPETAGDALFIQSITITENILTIIIGAASSAGDVITTVAAISLPKPIEPIINYPIAPIIPGIAGWLSFGHGALDVFSAKYSSLAQTKISPRNAHKYSALPIPSIRKQGLARALDGVITLTVDAPIVAEKKIVTINNKPAIAIIFKLDTLTNDLNYNPLSYFLGPCGVRPESGTCPGQPIETLNNVTPDCNGNINILVENADIYEIAGGGGFGIDIGLGLDDVCQKTPYGPPREPIDDCEPPISSSSSSAQQSSSSGSALPSSSSGGAVIPGSSSSSVGEIGSLPFCTAFNTNISNEVDVRSGGFDIRAVATGLDVLSKC
jgi:hypothetical protein